MLMGVLALLIEALSLVEGALLWQGSYHEVKLYGEGFAVECLAPLGGGWRCAAAGEDSLTAGRVEQALLAALRQAESVRLHRTSEGQQLEIQVAGGRVRCQFPDAWAYQQRPAGWCQADQTTEAERDNPPAQRPARSRPGWVADHTVTLPW